MIVVFWATVGAVAYFGVAGFVGGRWFHSSYANCQAPDHEGGTFGDGHTRLDHQVGAVFIGGLWPLAVPCVLGVWWSDRPLAAQRRALRAQEFRTTMALGELAETTAWAENARLVSETWEATR